MTEDYLPRDCAKNTHRYLNQVTKGQGMTIEEFITRVKVIKSYLPLIPMPMNDAQTEDQLCALVEHAVPGHYLRLLSSVLVYVPYERSILILYFIFNSIIFTLCKIVKFSHKAF
jgi:hypothetical protein